VVLSIAVTVYITLFEKLLAVTPLACNVLPTETDLPVVVKVATKAVTFVSDGTVAVIFVPLIVAVISDERAVLVSSVKPKSVIALASMAAVVLAVDTEFSSSSDLHPKINITVIILNKAMSSFLLVFTINESV